MEEMTGLRGWAQTGKWFFSISDNDSPSR